MMKRITRAIRIPLNDIVCFDCYNRLLKPPESFRSSQTNRPIHCLVVLQSFEPVTLIGSDRTFHSPFSAATTSTI